jgi:hypothetical protein
MGFGTKQWKITKLKDCMGEILCFNGILYAILVFLVPVLLIYIDQGQHVLTSFLVSSLIFNIYLVVKINKLRKK